MNSNVIKLIGGALLGVFILALIGILSVFAYHGKTSIEPVVYQIGTMIAVALSMLSALAGHAAGSKGATDPATAPASSVKVAIDGAAPAAPIIPPAAQP